MPDPANPNPNPPAPDPKPPTDPPAKPDTGKPPAPPPTPKGDDKAAAVISFTPDQLAELVDRRLAEREKAWEAERLPKLRDQVRDEIAVPLQAEGLIRNLREELKAAGKYLPKDDDATDPDNPGDIAALDPDDHFKVVRTNKDGTKYTKLNQEINRLRTRLMKDRQAVRVNGDALPTPGGADGADDKFYENIRTRKQAEEKARADAQTAGMNRVFNMP